MNGKTGAYWRCIYSIQKKGPTCSGSLKLENDGAVTIMQKHTCGGILNLSLSLALVGWREKKGGVYKEVYESVVKDIENGVKPQLAVCYYYTLHILVPK